MIEVKKTIALLMVLMSLFALPAIENRYASSMGLKSIAMTDTDMAAFVNPAQAFFYDNSHALEVGASVSDNWAEGFYKTPSFDFSATFSAKRIAIGFSSELITQKISKDVYSAYKDFNLDVDIAAGIGFFGAGVGVTLGSTRVRSELDIPESKRITELTKNVFFEEYKRVGGSEFATVKAGLDFDFGDVSVGIVLNDLYTNGDESISDAASHWGRGIDCGVFWQEKKFEERGKLKPVVFAAGIEAESVFSENGSFSVGGEATLQLVRDMTFSLRTGFTFPYENLKNPRQIVSIGAKITAVDCFVSLIIPYGNTDNELTFKAGATVLI